jgi:hypothetical protein
MLTTIIIFIVKFWLPELRQEPPPAPKYLESVCHRSIRSNTSIYSVFSSWLRLEHEASMKLPVLLQFLNLGQSVGLLGRVISSSSYLHRATQTQNKHINIHASSRIRIYDPGVPATQDSSRLRRLGYRDRRVRVYNMRIPNLGLYFLNLVCKYSGII